MPSFLPLASTRRLPTVHYILHKQHILELLLGRDTPGAITVLRTHIAALTMEEEWADAQERQQRAKEGEGIDGNP